MGYTPNNRTRLVICVSFDLVMLLELNELFKKNEPRDDLVLKKVCAFGMGLPTVIVISLLKVCFKQFHDLGGNDQKGRIVTLVLNTNQNKQTSSGEAKEY